VPRAFPCRGVYHTVAPIFNSLGLTGTIAGVVRGHTLPGVFFSVWIAPAAFAAVDGDLEAAARNIGASPLRTFLTITLPLAAPGIMASAIFVFLESLDEFTGTYFVGVPDVTTLPLLLFRASMEGNYQIASITALILLVPSIGFMLFIERFLKADVLAKIGN
jgi:ABC-type spermidine/putrescine transport system permease subunit II